MSVLTPAIIAQRTRSPLAEIRKLNLWGLRLVDVTLLSTLPKLQILCLSHNCLCSLESLTSCPSLRELFLRGNEIEDLEEVRYLAALPSLKILWLAENPIADHPSYRPDVLQILPNLARLDDGDVTDADRRVGTPGTGRSGRATIGATFPSIPPDEPPARRNAADPQASGRRGGASLRVRAAREPEPNTKTEQETEQETGKRRRGGRLQFSGGARGFDDREADVSSPSDADVAPVPRRLTPHDSGLDFIESLRRSGKLEQVSAQVERGEGGGDARASGRRRKDDRLILSAIMTLLPELKGESLAVVIGKCRELAK
jgi:hypothetical protein